MSKHNYEIKISWSDEDRCFIARVPELQGCMTDGKTEEEALSNAKEAICAYVEALKEEGKAVPISISSRSFSGKIPLRIPSDLHRSLAIKAASDKTSLNKLIEHIVSTSEVINIQKAQSHVKATTTMPARERKHRRKAQSA